MRLGDYELLNEVGRGGMGSVYRARSADGKTVAVKLLLRIDAEKRARFDRERRLLGELGEAEGFVPLLDAGDSAQGPYIVMPFVGGGTLRDKLKRGPLGIEEAVALARTLGRALGRAHAQGIVHRDLKPENILFREDGAPLVTDLGLAKHFDHSGEAGATSLSLSKTAETRGTFAYMGPEQLQDAKSVGPPADVFALGAILYECLAGQAAFLGDSVLEVTRRVALGTYTPLRRQRDDVPTWLVRVVSKALAPAVAERFADGDAFVEGLTAGPAAERTRRTKQMVASVVGLAGVGALLLGGARLSLAPADLSIAPVATVANASAASSTAHSAHETSHGPPPWFLALRPIDRPILPLPRGVVFGREPGEYVNEKDGSVLVYAPECTVTVGDPTPTKAPDELPRLVTLSAHFVGKYEVTYEQFAAFVASSSLRTRCEREHEGGVRDGVNDLPSPSEGLSWRHPRSARVEPERREPVTQVNREEATAYASWAGLRLLTECEWEHAARWDPATRRMRHYPWGDEGPRDRRVANLADLALRAVAPREMEIFDGYDDGVPYLAPVGSFPLGVSPLGAHDMCGNAMEWVADGYDPDTSRLVGRDPKEPGTAMLGVTRGGSFASRRGWVVPYHRHREEPTVAADDLGFRLARSAR